MNRFFVPKTVVKKNKQVYSENIKILKVTNRNSTQVDARSWIFLMSISLKVMRIKFLNWRTLYRNC